MVFQPTVTPLDASFGPVSGHDFRGCGKKGLSPGAKLTPIRIYIGVSTNNFVLLQIICRPRAWMMHETWLARTAQRAKLSRTTSCLDSDLRLPRIPRISRTVFVGLTTHTTHITHCFRRTYHAYHAYHAKISRISRKISVGHFCTTQEAKYTHNFKAPLETKDLAARRLQPRAQICIKLYGPTKVGSAQERCSG